MNEQESGSDGGAGCVVLRSILQEDYDKLPKLGDGTLAWPGKKVWANDGAKHTLYGIVPDCVTVRLGCAGEIRLDPKQLSSTPPEPPPSLSDCIGKTISSFGTTELGHALNIIFSDGTSVCLSSATPIERATCEGKLFTKLTFQSELQEVAPPSPPTIEERVSAIENAIAAMKCPQS